jgi:hypothetical protein
MSETFLNEIADQLRSQTPTAETSTSQQAQTQPENTETQAETTQQTTQTAEAQTQTSTETTQTQKEWWEQEETKTETPSTQTQTQAKTEEPAFELDDDMRLVLEYKKSGKTLADFVKEYQVEDYQKWDDEKIVKEGLKEFMNLSEDELQQASFDYDSASVFQKKQWAETFRERFAKKNEEKLKQLTSSNEQSTQMQKAIADKYNAEIESFSKNIVDKELFGLKITDEMSKDLTNYIDKEFTMQREDGTFDVEKIYSIALWLKYGKDLVKANITKARNEGKEQILREVSNPSKNMTGGGRTVGSGLEAAQEAFNALFPG